MQSDTHVHEELPQIHSHRSNTILYRLYGLAICFFSLKTYVSAYQTDMTLFTSEGAWSLHLLTLISFFILWKGSKPTLLLLAGLASMRCLVATHRSSEPLLWFPAAEWALLVALPLCSLIEQRINKSVKLTFQASFIATMTWAGLHKINVDFFNLQVSCIQLSQRLHEWWGIPMWVHQAISPMMVVIAELSVSIILLWKPRWGVLCTLLLLGHFGSIGATALATIVIAMALSFLSDSDLDQLFRFPKEHSILTVILIILVPLVSYHNYQAQWSWIQYGIFHVFFAIVFVATIMLWFDQVTFASHKKQLIPKEKVYLFSLLALWCFNGFTPYLGLKFHYSFSMLSNLRVDDDRWNSYVFPSTLRWKKNDDFIHVQRVIYRSALTGRLLRGGSLKPALYSPSLLRAYLDNAKQVNEQIFLKFTYHGVAHDFLNRPSQELFVWLSKVAHQPFIQNKLVIRNTTHHPGQRCVH